MYVYGNDLQMEEWRPVVGYDGAYAVSDLGRVRSRYVPRGGGRLGVGWILLRARPDRHGYQRVCLYLRGKRLERYVSHLVADVFLTAKLPTDMVVRHLNDVKTDNRVVNLLRGTHSDNMNDAIRNGKSKPPPACRGEEHPNAKLKASQVQEIRRLHAAGQMSERKLARKFDVSRTTIRLIITRQTWTNVE